MFEADVRYSLLCSDIFRDYEADYSAALSAEEVELQADETVGRKRREADDDDEEEEEGRGKCLLLLGMPPLPSIRSHPSCLLHPFLQSMTSAGVCLFCYFTLV